MAKVICHFVIELEETDVARAKSTEGLDITLPAPTQKIQLIYKNGNGNETKVRMDPR